VEKDIRIFRKDLSNPRNRFLGKIKQWFWVEKFENPVGIATLLVFSLIFGLLITYMGATMGVAIMAFLIVPLTLYGIVAYPIFGIYVLLIMAYMLFAIMRLGINFPLGTAMDGIQVLLILGFFIHQKTKPDWTVFKGSISLMILIWIGYNLMEVINPTAESRLAWLYTIRSVAFVMLMYFVFMYQIKSVKAIRGIMKLWLLLSFIAAVYAYKQEYIGFSEAEDGWLHSDPNIANLLFINGHWRKFSILSDPVAFSYNMVVSSIICIAMLTYVRQLWKKMVLFAMIALFFSAMLFSGTRGAYVLLPATMVLFLILRFSQKVLVGTAIAGVFILFLIMAPTSNPNIVRFQTAFKPANDDSFNLRAQNQKRIQPYILAHPIGGGLGATGTWGERFAPNSYLAKFPPDSGYVRVAVELGWLGLLIFCCLMFCILKVGINNYFTIQNPELKTYCLAVLMIVFAYNIGNYPQEALVQFPSSIYFYLAIALINVTKKIDVKEIAVNEERRLSKIRSTETRYR